MRAADLTGQTFGRLTVLRRAPSKKRRNGQGADAMVVCRCECGTERAFFVGHLRRGLSKSCGCRRREVSRSIRIRHGESRFRDGTKEMTDEYSVWSGIHKRCSNSGKRKHPNYAARGIAVCDRWFEYENFLADMGRRPSPLHSIDRIDNNGNYEPGNCRWATAREQCCNKRSNRMLTLGEVTLCMTEWSRRLNISVTTIQRRLARGLSDAEALGPTAAHYHR